MNAQKTSSFMQDNKTNILIGIIILLSLALLYYIVSPSKKFSQFVPSFSPTPTPKTYQTLSKELNTIVNSQNLKEAAQKANLAVDGNGIRVVILVKDADMKDKNQFFFMPTYGTQQLRYGNTIQATLLFNQIETVAKNPQVKSIEGVKKSIIPPGVNIDSFKKK